MIDLHVHTTASDGQYTPTQIIQAAAEKEFKAIAITDHDTLAGIPEAKEAAKQFNVNFIPGIEININTNRGEFHLLGLGIKETSSSMQTVIDNLIQNRNNRNLQMIEKMQADGLEDRKSTRLNSSHTS